MPNKFSRVFVTGGAGYVGSVLVPQLLERGYKVTSYDISYYGDNFLPKSNPNLQVIHGDIRDTAKLAKAIAGHDAFVSLACISNDASFELDENLSTSVNLDAFEPMVLAAKKAGVKRFIFASSSSVYGVSDQPNVTEDHPLVPLTLYNKYKGMCEPLLLKHTDASFVGVIFRPATVCGYAPRQRFDLSRQHPHQSRHQQRQDHRLRRRAAAPQPAHPGLLRRGAGAARRAGREDRQRDLQCRLSEHVDHGHRPAGQTRRSSEEFPEKGEIGIVTTPSDDKRSYHINSDKIRRVLGYAPKRTIEEAVRDLCRAFKDGRLPNSMADDIYYNVRRMKNLQAA